MKTIITGSIVSLLLMGANIENAEASKIKDKLKNLLKKDKSTVAVASKSTSSYEKKLESIDKACENGEKKIDSANKDTKVAYDNSSYTPGCLVEYSNHKIIFPIRKIAFSVKQIKNGFNYLKKSKTKGDKNYANAYKAIKQGKEYMELTPVYVVDFKETCIIAYKFLKDRKDNANNAGTIKKHVQDIEKVFGDYKKNIFSKQQSNISDSTEEFRRQLRALIDENQYEDITKLLKEILELVDVLEDCEIWAAKILYILDAYLDGKIDEIEEMVEDAERDLRTGKRNDYDDYEEEVKSSSKKRYRNSEDSKVY